MVMTSEFIVVGAGLGMLIWSEDKSDHDVCVFEHEVNSFFFLPFFLPSFLPFFFWVKMLIKLAMIHEKDP